MNKFAHNFSWNLFTLSLITWPSFPHWLTLKTITAESISISLDDWNQGCHWSASLVTHRTHVQIISAVSPKSSSIDITVYTVTNYVCSHVMENVAQIHYWSSLSLDMCSGCEPSHREDFPNGAQVVQIWPGFTVRLLTQYRDKFPICDKTKWITVSLWWMWNQNINTKDFMLDSGEFCVK